jgi:hypothetical protein
VNPLWSTGETEEQQQQCEIANACRAERHQQEANQAVADAANNNAMTNNNVAGNNIAGGPPLQVKPWHTINARKNHHNVAYVPRTSRGTSKKLAMRSTTPPKPTLVLL